MIVITITSTNPLDTGQKLNVHKTIRRHPERLLSVVTIPVPIPDQEEKLPSIFIFTLLCGVLKGFMKTLKASIKLFEAPQRSVKIKIEVNFYFNTTFLNTFKLRCISRRK